ncbi:protein fem-1 homolog C-like [Acanthaster planci]|uniref:Protein fem-1 homolog C-like n=1 Tax=Acanthaster planci TaxID=133434 RepID=A0A8B7ZDM6_ACAPL|nr:protein fem-1 homolog C-like [Acanthaster planci]
MKMSDDENLISGTDPNFYQSFKTPIFKAAQEGDLHRIQECLRSRTKEEVKWLVSQVVEKTTPLIAASRHGHLNVVNYFLEECKADVEQVGSVTFDGETIEGAPALWCAAAAGHFATVQSLMRHGARVNQTTFSNSTPLRAACFDGHFDIVRHLVQHGADIELANRHGHTCLMISCYKGHYDIAEYLLSLHADVNRKSIRGNTALHDCAESGSLAIMKLLLKHNAVMDIDAYGMTPIKAAAVAGHSNIVDYLVTVSDVPKIEKVESLELLGATAVDKKRDMHQALRYWQRALDERSSDPANIIKKVPTKAIPAYECSIEVDSTRDLENMIGDPDEMRMQALLIRERILGPTHPDTTYYIRYRGAVYADSGNFDRCITLWMYALDMQQQALEPLNPMTQSSLLSFAELFAYMLSERNGERVCSDLKYSTVSVVYLKGISEIKRGIEEAPIGPPSDKDAANFHRALLILMHLMCLIAKLDGTVEEEDEVRQATYRFLKLKPTGSKGATPLHLAVEESTSSVGRYPVCRFPDYRVLRLLLACGADVNRSNTEGNRPLHIAAKGSSDGLVKHDRSDILRMLLDHGAHLDCRNDSGKAPLDLLGDALCDISPINYTTLQCLAARAVMKHGLKYIGIIPKRLEEFVKIH